MTMPHFVFIFLLLVSSLSLILILIGEVLSGRRGVDIDSQYYNPDVDHIYYERSLIEKKEFHKRFPHIRVRNFANLFHWKHRVLI